MSQTMHIIIAQIIIVLFQMIMSRYFGYIYKDHFLTRYGERHAQRLSQWVDRFLSKLL